MQLGDKTFLSDLALVRELSSNDPSPPALDLGRGSAQYDRAVDTATSALLSTLRILAAVAVFTFVGEPFVAKQQRGNAYLMKRLEDDHPAIFSYWKAGRYPSARQALIAAGLKKPPTQINALKNAWRKASAKEKRDFLAFVGVSIPAPVAASKPSVATSSSSLDAKEHLLPAVGIRIKAIMTARRIKMGTVMSEMGFGTLNPALGNAMSPARPTRVLPDKASALEKWLEANKSIAQGDSRASVDLSVLLGEAAASRSALVSFHDGMAPTHSFADGRTISQGSEGAPT